MRIRLFTGVVALLLGVFCTAQEATNPEEHADRVLVFKKEHTLQLIRQEKVIHTYKVALGGDPVGPKTRQGDHKTPEGTYVLDSRNAHSQFYKSLHISYPNASDRAAARQKGVSPGGDVFVHGLPNGYGWVGASHRLKDWTDGCIAVPTKKWTRSGTPSPTGRQLKSVHKDETAMELWSPSHDEIRSPMAVLISQATMQIAADHKRLLAL